jgi:hypothetical protein
MLFVRDDEGMVWFFLNGRIRLLEAEQEMGSENGYPCSSFENGIDLLNKAGYITLNQNEIELWNRVKP